MPERDFERVKHEASSLMEASGAATLPHPGGTLLAHLQRTSDLLTDWGASPSLVLAGLCHATYGTDGFNQPLLDRSARSRLVSVIGVAAEEIAYFYASCDRGFTYPQIVKGEMRFRDRFTDEVTVPATLRLRPFFELTFANELDVMRHNASFAAEAWPQLVPVFNRADTLVSTAAWTAYTKATLAFRSDA
jgi:hypothetical protein